ncbi:hypothetical protein MPH_03183 [Macrophomina phaseolina MS6]|uniref:Uncharacterized protein n=1 Tax=Macrophomina phaseolina (strain MS6) TaxID=1126212 RepID=K2SRJ3_MACPH|nr:hypothetical protein MPH_03183 [Macrophomina phaseolina MS6]
MFNRLWLLTQHKHRMRHENHVTFEANHQNPPLSRGQGPNYILGIISIILAALKEIHVKFKQTSTYQPGEI